MTTTKFIFVDLDVFRKKEFFQLLLFWDNFSRYIPKDVKEDLIRISKRAKKKSKKCNPS